MRFLLALILSFASCHSLPAQYFLQLGDRMDAADIGWEMEKVTQLLAASHIKRARIFSHLLLPTPKLPQFPSHNLKSAFWVHGISKVTRKGFK